LPRHGYNTCNGNRKNTLDVVPGPRLFSLHKGLAEGTGRNKKKEPRGKVRPAHGLLKKKGHTKPAPEEVNHVST